MNYKRRMKEKLCKWFYDHGKFRMAYRISPSYAIQLIAEDVQNALIEGIKEAVEGIEEAREERRQNEY